MTSYKYVAKKHTGDTIESIIYAASIEEARKKIEEMGFVPELVEEITAPDRRMYERLAVEIPVWFGPFKPGRPVNVFPVQAQTRNVSAGGMLIEARNPVNSGVVLCVRFALPPQSQIECLARVVRSHPLPDEGYQIAVSFVTITNDERNALNHYILDAINHNTSSGEQSHGNI